MFINPHSLIALDLQGNNLREIPRKKLGRVYMTKYVKILYTEP